jgi:hypothetical protein
MTGNAPKLDLFAELRSTVAKTLRWVDTKVYPYDNFEILI